MRARYSEKASWRKMGLAVGLQVLEGWDSTRECFWWGHDTKTEQRTYMRCKQTSPTNKGFCSGLLETQLDGVGEV